MNAAERAILLAVRASVRRPHRDVPKVSYSGPSRSAPIGHQQPFECSSSRHSERPVSVCSCHCISRVRPRRPKSPNRSVGVWLHRLTDRATRTAAPHCADSALPTRRPLRGSGKQPLKPAPKTVNRHAPRFRASSMGAVTGRLSIVRLASSRWARRRIPDSSHRRSWPR